MKASDIKKSQLLKNEGRVCRFAETSGFSCWLKSERGNPREGAAGEITWGGQCGRLLRLLNVSFEPWNFCYAWSGFNNSLCRIIGNWLRKWVWDIKREKKNSFEEEFLWKLELSLWLSIELGRSALTTPPPFSAAIPWSVRIPHI